MLDEIPAEEIGDDFSTVRMVEHATREREEVAGGHRSVVREERRQDVRLLLRLLLALSRKIPFDGVDFIGEPEEVEVPNVTWRDERNRISRTPHATGSSGAMDVHVERLGESVVDHVCHVRDVDASSRHVGGYEKPRVSAPHAPHRFFAVCLGEVAGDPVYGEAVPLEAARDDLNVLSGIAEDHRGVGILRLDDLHEIVDSPCSRNHVEGVLNLFGSHIVVGKRNDHRLHEVALGQPLELPGDCGGEQERLPAFRDLLEDRRDLFFEPHGEHFVGLVEDQITNIAQHQGASSDVIQNSSGSADDCLDPCLQLLELLVDRRAAVDRYDR